MLTILPTYYYYPSRGTTKGRRVPMQYAPCTYLSARDGGMHYAVVTRLLTTNFIFLHSKFHSFPFWPFSVTILMVRFPIDFQKYSTLPPKLAV